MLTGDHCPVYCPGTGWARWTSVGSPAGQSPSPRTPGVGTHWISPRLRGCTLPSTPGPHQALAPNFVSSACRKIEFAFFSISKNWKQTNWKNFALEKYLFDVVWCLNCPWNFFQLHLKKKRKVDACPKPCFSLNHPP